VIGTRKLLALASLPLATLALAACGGSGDAETTGEEDGFAAAADRICVADAKRDITTRHDATTGGETEFLRQLLRNRRQTLRRLEQLTPPDDATAGFERLLAARREIIARLEDGIEAAAAGDTATLDRFRAAARRRLLAAEDTAAEIGLTACAGTLPPSERAEVEAAIAASTEPARAGEFCRDHVSEAMVASNFGGSVARCIDQQTQRATTDSVAIDELRGVAGVSADVIVSLLANDERAGAYEAALVREGGSWRLDAVSPAPES